MNALNIDLLSADHADLDRLLNDVFVALMTADCRKVFETLDLFWARLAMHIRAEHLHLFPALLDPFQVDDKMIGDAERSSNSIADIIDQLHSDHDYFMVELAGAIKQVRSLIENGDSDASPVLANITTRLESLRARLKTHDEIEEAEIYTLADRIHSPAEALSFNNRIRNELENLPPRFVNRVNVGI